MTNVKLTSVEKPANQIRVGLCVPMRGTIESNFMASFINIIFHFLQKPNTIPLPIFSETMPIDGARNEISKQAILAQCDYLLWLDSDIVLSPDMIEHMWNLLHTPDDEGNERCVVTGVYYSRAPPFHPVLRNFHKFHRFFDPENVLMTPVIEYPRDRPFTVDGAGMGCVLMKRKANDLVFNETKGRPFQFVADRVSEDLFFFAKLREGVKDHQGNVHHFKVWCDPVAQCAHLGCSVSEWHYKHAQYERYLDVSELARFVNESQETVLQRCLDAPFTITQAWVKIFGSDSSKYKDIPQEKLDEFYKALDYRYDLTFYWFNDPRRRESILRRFAFAENREFNCLDFGCGVGDFGLNVAENYKNSKVVFYDPNAKNIEYLKWRIANRTHDGEISLDRHFVLDDRSQLEKLDGVSFEVIFCLDVLEHIKDPLPTAKWLFDHLAPQGLMLCQVAPMKQLQPQHVSQIDLRDAGFVQLDEFTFCRPENEVCKKIAEYTKTGQVKPK